MSELPYWQVREGDFAKIDLERDRIRRMDEEPNDVPWPPPRARRMLVLWVRLVPVCLGVLVVGVFLTPWYPRAAAVVRFVGNLLTVGTLWAFLAGTLAFTQVPWRTMPRKAKACFIIGAVISIVSTVWGGYENILVVFGRHH